MIQNLPELEHVNIKKVVPHTISTFILYESLVLKFLDQYKNIDLQLSALHFQDIVHTLKGLCGTLGAEHLYHLAQELEEQPNERRLELFMQELHVVCDELGEHFHPYIQDETLKIKLDPKEIQKLFSELEKVLATQRPKRIQPILEKLESVQLDKEDLEIFNEVQKFVKEYEFKKAMQYLVNVTGQE